MNRFFLFVFLQFAFFSAFSQVQTHIVGDSVRVHSNSGKGELILQNATDSVKGFLYNKGGGRTEFRKGLIKISDSMYLIGADTLRLSVSGSAGSLGLQQITLVGDSTSNRIVVGKLITDTILSIKPSLYVDSMHFIAQPSKYNLAITNTPLASNTATHITAFGTGALQSNTSGAYNYAIGDFALSNNTTGKNNAAVGSYALWSNLTGINNTAIGLNALAYSTSSYNTAIGCAALFKDTSGEQNTAIGYGALDSNRTGSKNIAIGVSAMYNANRGNFNTAIGNASLLVCDTGSYNLAIGYRAGYITKGSGNVYLGYEAGSNDTGSNKLYIANSGTSRPLIYGSFKDTSLVFNGSVTTTGKQTFGFANIPVGTNGNQTINKPSGIVNIAAAGASITVTDNLVTTNSIVIAVIRTNDSTAVIKNVVPGAGTFTINLSSAATAATSIGFIVYN